MFVYSFMKLKLIYTVHIFDFVVSTTNKFVPNYVDENLFTTNTLIGNICSYNALV